MYLAQYECYRYRTEEYTRDDPHNIHYLNTHIASGIAMT